jgi:7-carboxy-7-deazaguanine synthase
MKLFPIVEIFGPTFQGEGSMAGQQTYFVRFGGCDYRCKWCDTMYAVDPEQVKNAHQMNSKAIIQNIENLPGHPKWVTFSGGNPLLFDFLEIVALLHQRGFYVAAETQGSIYTSRPCVSALDLLILSPKPPSSGMITDFDALRHIGNMNLKHTVKVVVFDQEDYEYAKEIRNIFPYSDFWISVGTDQIVEAQERTERRILSRATDTLHRPSHRSNQPPTGDQRQGRS